MVLDKVSDYTEYNFVTILLFPAVTVKNYGLETLTLHISSTDGPRTHRCEPYLVPINLYKLAELGCSRFRVSEMIDVESEIVRTSKPEVGMITLTSGRYWK